MNDTPIKTAPNHQPYMNSLPKADTPTPRTDALSASSDPNIWGLCRELERDLVAAREQFAEQARDMLDLMNRAERAEAELARVKAEREAAVNSAEKWRGRANHARSVVGSMAGMSDYSERQMASRILFGAWESDEPAIAAKGDK